MDYATFDVQALQSLLDGAASRSDPEALAIAEFVTRSCCAALLAAQQSAINDADAAFTFLDNVRRAGDRAAVPGALRRWQHAYSTASWMSHDVTECLRKLLADTVAANAAILPHLQSAGAASIAAMADLELRCLNR